MRKAILTDLPEIMHMVKQTIAEMHSYNNWQWDENYPRESDFAADIDKGELFVSERNGRLAGFVCINQMQPHEYNEVKWSKDEPAFVVHRMVVGEEYRCQGVGTELVHYADEQACRHQVSYLKTDTYSLNNNAQKIFEKCGYRKCGTMNFRGLEKPFICYEKIVNQEL